MTHGIEIIKRMNEQASKPPKPTGTEKRVCDDIAKRQVKGVSKYGTTVENSPLSQRQWLRHAYEEALDLAIYLRRTIDDASKPANQPDTSLAAKIKSVVEFLYQQGLDPELGYLGEVIAAAREVDELKATVDAHLEMMDRDELTKLRLLKARDEAREKAAKLEERKHKLWRDCSEWLQLAKRQRREMDNPNHNPLCPSQAAIDATTQLLFGQDTPTDAPDPGEGYEVCASKDHEFAWNGKRWVKRGHASQWYEGAPKHYRRRIVMTEPPSKEAVGDDVECWVKWRDKYPGHDNFNGSAVRLWWDDSDVDFAPIAWCHELPGEDKPPQMLLDWKPEELESVKDWNGIKTMQVGGDKVSNFKPSEPTPQRQERFLAWIDSCTDCDGTVHEWDRSKRIVEWLPGDPTPEEVAELWRQRDALQACVNHTVEVIEQILKDDDGVWCIKRDTAKAIVAKLRNK